MRDIFSRSRQVRDSTLGPNALLRAVIEITNTCHHNCMYCGMRVANTRLGRYSLDAAEILHCAQVAHEDQIATVMLQGGDDLRYDIGALGEAVSIIREEFRQEVLLCLGDRPIRDYKRLYLAGARQAILKFETSNKTLYKQLRPHSSLDKRLGLLASLVDIGYATSSGFIVGLPGANNSDMERDLELVEYLDLFAASVSPFVPSEATPLGAQRPPSLNRVLQAMARMRLSNPRLLIPAVSALDMLALIEGCKESGQKLGLLAGANVITVNYTPTRLRKSYVIYSERRKIVELPAARFTIKQAGMVEVTSLGPPRADGPPAIVGHSGARVTPEAESGRAS